ncbi:MAG: hypothetical protein UDB11_00510 [Peptococcaceae bacterium]|nr:hypothetical protein [Peptococcaceae bacterium]
MSKMQAGRFVDDGFDMMWRFMEMGGQRANYPALKEACLRLRQMMMQKTAGQRKDRKSDIPWEELETTVKIITVEAMALVLSGEFEEVNQNEKRITDR